MSRSLKAKFAMMLISLLVPVSTAHASDSPTVFGWMQGLTSYNDAGGVEFNLIRTRAGLMGGISQRWKYFFVAEAGKYAPFGAGKFAIIDAFITYEQSPGLNISIGQDFYKFSLEGSTLTWQLPLIDRSEVVNDLWDTMGRNGYYAEDVGIWVRGRDTSLIPLQYFFSITNGTGMGAAEDNRSKDLSLRLCADPTGSLHFGASAFNGYSRVESHDLNDNVFGLELGGSVGELKITGEILWAHYEGTHDDTLVVAPVSKRGGYMLAQFDVRENVSLLARFAHHDPNRDELKDEIDNLTLGCTYIPLPHHVVKLNFSHRTSESIARNDVHLLVQLDF